MASKYWIKLYHEILDDPKMGRLSDRLFRRCIQLFLIAGEEDSDGLLPRPDDMAWRLRPLSIEELENDLDELAKVGIVSKTDNGWIVVHFAERQKAVGGTERVRRFRDRQKADEYYGAKDETEKPKSNADVTIYNEESNATVTKRYTDKDIESELESLPNGNGDKSPPTFEPEVQEPETQDGQGEPAVTKSELEPANEQEALLFELLKPEFIAKNHRPPNKFPSLACKRKYVARAKYLGDNTGPAIERALQKGIASVTGIVDFIAKWNPENENKARNNGHETSRYKPPAIDAEAYRHLEAQNAANTGGASRAGPPASRDRPAE